LDIQKDELNLTLMKTLAYYCAYAEKGYMARTGQMAIKSLCVVILVLIAICQQWGWCQDAAAIPSQAGSGLEASLSRQQKINRASLLEGANDQIRIDAAIELLLSEDKLARQVLLEALKQTEHAAAQAAVCKALAQSRLSIVRNKSDFTEPLFNILLAQPDAPAKLAAEAMVIFDYKQVASRLDKTATDDNADTSARLHAIYALKLRPEKAAIFALIKLLDNKNKQIADAAAAALQDSLGIPAGTEPKVWEQIAKELDRKSPDEFIRDRLVRQEARVHQLEAGIKRWQSLYISALDNLYKAINDDNAKTAFLTERLTSSEPEVQLWAIRRVSEWRMGNKPLPPAFGPILLGLISANDTSVRLETARLLALTSYLGPAPQLLKQLQAEKDDEVKTELFVALGEACNYAAVSKDVTVPDEIQKNTRELAAQYLAENDEGKARRGAEVLGKLLMNNVVDKTEAQKYFEMLSQRYDLEKTEPNNPLRSRLLDVMAGLCGQTAAYRVQAAQTFEPVFVEALADKESPVREAAVLGFIKIDGPRALAVLAANDMNNDPSSTIRASMMDLAGKIGGPNDLPWLAMKISGTNGESDAAWRAMTEIFKRSDSTFLAEWISRFNTDPNMKLTPDRKIAFLEMAEQKADAENNAAILNAVRKRLADAYAEEGQFDKSAQYYGVLVETANGTDRDALLARLLEVRLKAKQFDAAAQLLANRLLEKDVDANDVLAVPIGRYLDRPENRDNAILVLKSLDGIAGAANRSKWQQCLKQWRARFEPNQPPSYAPAADANKTATAVLTPGKI
jgi:HEAT repeat protein